MEKEFIPYEEALELKKLGFDEPCFFAFDNCSTPMRCTDLRTNEQEFNGVNYNSSSYTSQPTFSQAFGFFRKNYWYTALILSDSFQIVTQISTSKTFDVNTGVYSPNYITQTYHKEEGLKSYDESELACLRKLIEIVKGGNK